MLAYKCSIITSGWIVLGTIGRVQRVARAESPGCLAMGKTKSPCTTPAFIVNF